MPINSFCMKTTIKELKCMDGKLWLEKMIKAYPDVHEGECSESQKSSWKNEFEVLTKALKRMPDEYNNVALR